MRARSKKCLSGWRQAVRLCLTFFSLSFALLFIRWPGNPGAANPGPISSKPVRFAVIGDYGSAGEPEADVARLVAGWDIDFIITTGDNNYPGGAESTIDTNIGQYYHSFIAPYTGRYGAGAVSNRFFPILGNEDWAASGAQPYFDYFALPGNERYYDFVAGPVHFFALDSDPHEPDGITADSAQGNWLHDRLQPAGEPWKIVYFHHPPFSSGVNGSTTALHWPFEQWGASAVLSGHDHDYERVMRDGFPYFVNGLGGRSTSGFLEPVQGSVVRYQDDYGAMLVQAGELTISYKFITRTGEVIDTYVACRATEWLPGRADCLAPVNGGRKR
jgi:tartrate-resistant acid phosphatase type 5